MKNLILLSIALCLYFVAFAQKQSFNDIYKLCQAKKYKEAIPQLREFIKEETKHIAAHYELGKGYEATGNPDSSIYFYNKASELMNVVFLTTDLRYDEFYQATKDCGALVKVKCARTYLSERVSIIEKQRNKNISVNKETSVVNETKKQDILPCDTLKSIPKRNDWKELNIKGKVSKIKETSYELYTREQIKDGNQIDISQLTQLGDRFISFTCLGGIISDEDYRTRESFYFLYDSIGNKTQEIQYKHLTERKIKIIYKYDKNGNVIEKDYSERAIVGDNYKKVFKYDEKGNVINENHHRIDDDKIIMKFTHKYDEKGNEIELNIFNVTQSYSKTGDANSIPSLVESELMLTEKITTKYNAKGNDIEENFWDRNGKLKKKHSYKYDDFGNITENVSFNSDGSIKSKYSFQYDYDKNDNWIRKIEYKNDDPRKVTVRVIKYFN